MRRQKGVHVSAFLPGSRRTEFTRAENCHAVPDACSLPRVRHSACGVHYLVARGASRRMPKNKKPGRRNSARVGISMVRRQGFEPWTLGLRVPCSGQLS